MVYLYQIGVVSWGYGCAMYWPGVYARFTPFHKITPFFVLNEGFPKFSNNPLIFSRTPTYDKCERHTRYIQPRRVTSQMDWILANTAGTFSSECAALN